MTDYSSMTIEELEKEVAKIFEMEGRPDEFYRTTIFMGQLEFAKHIYHDRKTEQARKYSPDTRPYKGASKTAEISSFGQALIQLLLLIHTRKLEFNRVFEYAVEHLKDQEWRGKTPVNRRGIKGIPIAGGRILGRAYLVSDKRPLEEAPDESIIVIGHAGSDISQHLGRVKGVVTDHGGKLCHLATVAREMGKPAVVGTGNATMLINHGDRIMVDADNGVVIRNG